MESTIFVEGDPNGEYPELGVEIEYRTRCAQYIGEFVLHRYILPHEECRDRIGGNRTP
jgi:hypothetical protein